MSGGRKQHYLEKIAVKISALNQEDTKKYGRITNKKYYLGQSTRTLTQTKIWSRLLS